MVIGFPKPWYSKFGPLSWYRPKGLPLEWVALEFFSRRFRRLYLRLKFRRVPEHQIWTFRIQICARVHRFSMFGNPSATEGGLGLRYQSRDAWFGGALASERGWTLE